MFDIEAYKNYEQYFETEKENSFELLAGKGKIIVSAPHSVEQTRQGKKKYAEPQTGAIAKLLHDNLGIPVIYKTKNCGDDANFDEASPYKDALVDYIKENISKIKILISDVLGSNILKEICFDCRLVILTQSFSSFDFSSIKYLPYNVEAINYIFLEKNIVFVKEYQNKCKDYKNYRGYNNKLYIELEDFLLSLGDEVNLFGYKNIMEVPKLDKVVINMGVGEAKDNHKVLESAVADLEKITGQKAVITKARKSVANFKIREGMAIGCKVTLRGEKMYEFVDRLINLALPRVRDFRGVNPNAFDGRGNYALGIKEQLIFPEIEYDKIDRVRGMDIIFVTTAKTDEEARELLGQFGMPYTK